MTSGSAPGRAADRVRTIFLGSGSFAVPVLETLANHPRVELVGVITAPDRPAGRGNVMRATPVALRARSMWAPLLQPARLRDADAVAAVAALQPEVGVLADYGQIVPQEILDLPRLGILGVHPSPLPRHRGATPIQATIRDGDAEAGLTIYRMDAGVDTGPIVAATGWALTGRETAPQLEAEAARRGAELLGETLPAVIEGTIEPVPQPESPDPATRALRRAQGRLDPRQGAATLERAVRAHLGWPGSFIETAAGRLLILGASVAPAQSGDAPGMLVEHEDRLALATGEGRLVLDVVQLAGKRAMTGEDFRRGRPELVGSVVGGGTPAAPPDAAAERIVGAGA